jgi:outer membrane lipoprotein carrier protein
MLKKMAFFAGLMLSFNVFADPAADTLTHLLLNINTMKADFTQSVQDKSRMLQQTKGQMSLSRPGKFRWDTVQPNKQLIIANGSRLWIYDVDLEQVTIRTFHKAAGQTPALLLSDKSLTLSRDFNVKNVDSPSQIAGLQVFMLTPRNSEDSFAMIKLSFINKQIRQMQLEDKLGHVTTISFSHVVINTPLSDSLFTFKPGANVDVIDETKTKHLS